MAVNDDVPTEPLAAIVIGAGPAGLAAAAALGRVGVQALVLERSDAVGSSWRRHYERLHLHTTRTTSHLPGLGIPRSAGRWVSRADLVDYLERYVVHHGLHVRTGVEVVRLDRAPGGGWAVRTATGEVLTAPRVVVATGYNHTPVPLDLPGVDTFTGQMVHAAQYRVADPFRGQDVLVVGVGNSGAEIAVDLVEAGAARVRLAVRTPPHIVRRSTFGWPAQGTGMLVRHLPDALVDRVAAVQTRLTMPDLSAQGLPRPRTGLATRVRAGAIPVQDVGLIAAVQSGSVTVVPAVVGFDQDAVVLADGSRVHPDAVVAATGYRTGLEPMVGHLGVLDGRGLPLVHGAQTVASAPGLHLIGYANPISGALREMRLESRRIAATVRDAPAPSRSSTAPTDAHEIHRPVDLQRPDGTLDPAAVGWTRTPLHSTDRVGGVARRWGRAKRWEYWALVTPTHVVGLTVSALDYAGLTQVWVLDRASGEQVDEVVVVPLARGTQLPGTYGTGPASARTARAAIRFVPSATGTRLRAATARVRLDAFVPLPAGHERLGVVVPWDARTFQYTLKDVGRPVTGQLTVDGVTCDVGGWATLDHGRGYWPRELAWNWGFGAGVVGGHTIGLQLGGRWTDGTGSTENALVVDGRLHKLGEDLAWTWTPGRWTDPWQVRGDRADLTFTPFFDRVSLTDLRVVRSSTHQCFGSWSGWVRDDDGVRRQVDGIEGSVEDVEQRW